LGTESFYIISEFAVGVAGFSAIVIAIGHRADEMDALARFRVLTLLSNALTAAFGGLVPQLFASFGLAGSSLWFWSSIVLGSSLVALLVDAFVRRSRLSRTEGSNINQPLWLVLTVSLAGLALLQVANALTASPSPGPVFAGLVGILGNASLIFIRFVVARPRVRPAI
jgi:hypothetical protein